MLCLLSLAVMFIGFNLNRHDRVVRIALALIYFFLYGFFLFVLNSKIIIADGQLIYRTMFRRTKTYPLDQITQVTTYYSGISKTPSAYHIIVAKRKIRIEPIWDNFEKFFPVLKKHLKSINHACNYSTKINGVDTQDMYFHKKQKILLRQPRATAIFSAFFTLLASIYVIFFVVKDKTVVELLPIIVIWLFCLLCFCVHFIWKIEFIVDEPYFLYRPFIGKTTRIFYHEILYYKEFHNLLTIKTVEKSIRVPTASPNIAYLLQALKENRICKK